MRFCLIVCSSLVLSVMMESCHSGKGLNADEFQQLSGDYETCATKVLATKQQIADIIAALNQSGPGRASIQLKLQNTGFSNDQIDILKQRMRSETDEGNITMLEHALELNDELRERCEELADITRSLPDPHVVKAGENHYSLSLAFLQKKYHLSRTKSDSLIDRVALTSDLIEGFHVWFIYADGIFGTFVSQGSASISPNSFAKVMRRQAMDQARRQGRDEAFETILDSLRKTGQSTGAIRALAGK
jgi:hypothetical protein